MYFCFFDALDLGLELLDTLTALQREREREREREYVCVCMSECE